MSEEINLQWQVTMGLSNALDCEIWSQVKERKAVFIRSVQENAWKHRWFYPNPPITDPRVCDASS